MFSIFGVYYLYRKSDMNYKAIVRADPRIPRRLGHICGCDNQFDIAFYSANMNHISVVIRHIWVITFRAWVLRLIWHVIMSKTKDHPFC